MPFDDGNAHFGPAPAALARRIGETAWLRFMNRMGGDGSHREMGEKHWAGAPLPGLAGGGRSPRYPGDNSYRGRPRGAEADGRQGFNSLAGARFLCRSPFGLQSTMPITNGGEEAGGKRLPAPLVHVEREEISLGPTIVPGGRGGHCGNKNKKRFARFMGGLSDRRPGPGRQGRICLLSNVSQKRVGVKTLMDRRRVSSTTKAIGRHFRGGPGKPGASRAASRGS